MQNLTFEITNKLLFVSPRKQLSPGKERLHDIKLEKHDFLSLDIDYNCIIAMRKYITENE